MPRLVRFTRRAFINNRLIEPGEEMWLPDNFKLAAYMEDVLSGETGAHGPAEHKPSFLDHRGDAELHPPPGVGK